MPGYGGNAFLLKIGTSGTAGTTIAAMEDTTLSMDGQMIDVSTKDSAGFRELLDGGGQKTLSITARGVMTDGTTTDLMMTRVRSGTITAYGLVFGDGDVIDGNFQVTHFGVAGPRDDKQTYDITLESANAWTLTTA